jgi:cell division protein FtsB
MRYISAALLVLLAVVHAELSANQSAQARNAQLVAEVSDLKEGLEMVEERARYELGMIKPDEILVQLSTPRP